MFPLDFRSVHIHTPSAHIGTVHGSFPGQIIPALDLFLFLQELAGRSLEFKPTYTSLSRAMQTKVNRAYRHRSTALDLNHDAGEIWDHFSKGVHIQHGRGPLGIDLLLGNNEVWGFEPCSYKGYSVIHLAGSRLDGPPS